MKIETHISLAPTDQEFDLKLNFSCLLFLSSFLQQLSGSPYHLPPATKITTTGKSVKNQQYTVECLKGLSERPRVLNLN